MAVESQLMRTCAPLYSAFALESLWTLLLAIFFSYLSVLISSKQQLDSPGKAVYRFLCHHFQEWVSDTWRILKRWDTMHQCDMGQRFRYCRRLNATICRVQVAAALLAVTRWLHVNNVNGFRYLGYSFTCPLMQAELILLIAPAVPCYRLNVVVTMLITNAVMLTGWYASTLEGDLWTTDWQDIIFDGNLSNLTQKGWITVPSVVGVLVLSFVQIPWLALMYNCAHPSNMPEGFNGMLLLTGVSWLGFPLWWFLSFEGASIIEDTKLNGFGFMLLNLIAKGGFTLYMISMVKAFKRKNLATPKPRTVRSGSVASVESLPPLPGDAPPEPLRQERKLPTGQSLVWMINAMKPFDGDEEQGQMVSSIEGTSRAPTRGAHLKNEDLVAELMCRMDMNPDVMSAVQVDSGLHFGAKDKMGQTSFDRSVNAEIANACLRFIDEEDSD